jgi:D-alanyl-lipoteichoic acid acyltransferase DltB (MBOAT superfamily)
MQFDSLTFLIFFAVTLTLYYSIRSWTLKKNLLLLASYIFYAAWNPLFLPLLMGTSLFDWSMAKQMARVSSPRGRKIWLWGILATNLIILGYFKYAYFIASSLSPLLEWAGAEVPASNFDIILPIGISFYTFHSLSYCIDIYRGKYQPVKSLRDYLLYVSFFPQLVAGPIVRWNEMRDQLATPPHTSTNTLGVGLCLLVAGLFEKTVLADAVFAPVADSFFDNPNGSALTAWTAALAFSGQIFCDFAGYTTCALGAALMLGFRLPINFLNPYAAIGFSDFWRRWHISLSRWLRDYLYISLGGNQRGTLYTYRNLLLTMFIGGLWHGAAWTFAIWGLIHGLLLIAERRISAIAFMKPLKSLVALRLIYGLFTFCVITVTWVWFRAPSLSSAVGILAQMFQPANTAWVLNGAQQLALLSVVMLIVGQWTIRNTTIPEVIARTPAMITGLVVGLLVSLIVASPGDSHAFIYFQF